MRRASVISLGQSAAKKSNGIKGTDPIAVKMHPKLETGFRVYPICDVINPASQPRPLSTMTAVSHGFREFDRPIHRTHCAILGLDQTVATTSRTSRLLQAVGCHLTSSRRLDHLAQPLADIVSREFDLIEMRRLIDLVHCLQLGHYHRCLLEMKFEFLFQICSLRVHASHYQN